MSFRVTGLRGDEASAKAVEPKYDIREAIPLKTRFDSVRFHFK